jgi:cell division septal protein FtsQ
MRFGRRIRTQTLRQRRRQIVVEGMAYLLAIIGSVILLLSQISMVDALQIHRVEMRGNDMTPSRELLKVVQEKVRGHYISLFSRGNILLYPRWGIEREILERFPRVKEVDVDFKNLTAISVNVVERKPVARYCETNTVCFFLDEGGFIFALAPVVSGTSSDDFVYRGGGVQENPVGEHFLAPDMFRPLAEFVRAVATMGIEPMELTVAGEREYRLLLSGGAEVIFTPEESYVGVLENLRIVLGANELKTHLADGRLLEVEYIDLRFGNKVFYRLHDTNLPDKQAGTQIENE